MSHETSPPDGKSLPVKTNHEGAPRRVVFVTGTRADFGKIKSLISALNADPIHFEVHIFATGMHMEPKYGSTVREIEKCGFRNIYRFANQSGQGIMDRALAHTILGFGDYVRRIQPDLIVVHGDRVEALAGAMVGCLQNIRVAHVEGGEVSGTIDGVIRHAVSKMSHLHFVSNDDAKKRLVQLGEVADSIHVIGSPDLDIMRSARLPSLAAAKKHYEIPFDNYALLVFHPVTTQPQQLEQQTQELVAAARESGHNFIAIYPNSDTGSHTILKAYEAKLARQPWAQVYPSIRFEFMLVLLKHAQFVLGNSSMGIHEAPFYGVPTVNVGSRQDGRSHNPHILHVEPARSAILPAIARAKRLKATLKPIREFGDGDSHQRFYRVLKTESLWQSSMQKRFCDLPLISAGARRSGIAA